MSTEASAAILSAEVARGGFNRAVDRWIWVFMAALFVATALAGFIPDSIGVLGAVKSGQRPPLPTILHIHAVLMGTWLLMLLAQSMLMAIGFRSLHRNLGLLSIALLPAIVVAGIVLVITNWHSVWDLAAAPPPGFNPAVLIPVKTIQTNVLLGQLRTAVLFPLFVIWALLVRGRDAGAHKRFMILATVTPLGAGIDRFLTVLGIAHQPASPVLDLYSLALLLPLFEYDILRHGRLHRATALWLLVNLPFALALNLLFGSAWWAVTAPQLMGVHALPLQ